MVVKPGQLKGIPNERYFGVSYKNDLLTMLCLDRY
jgi:hypothetical protein